MLNDTIEKITCRSRQICKVIRVYYTTVMSLLKEGFKKTLCVSAPITTMYTVEKLEMLKYGSLLHYAM